MSSQQATVDAKVLAGSGAGDVCARKMFGEYALYCDGKVVGLICNDDLLIANCRGPENCGPGRRGFSLQGSKNQFVDPERALGRWRLAITFDPGIG